MAAPQRRERSRRRRAPPAWPSAMSVPTAQALRRAPGIARPSPDPDPPRASSLLKIPRKLIAHEDEPSGHEHGVGGEGMTEKARVLPPVADGDQDRGQGEPLPDLDRKSGVE